MQAGWRPVSCTGHVPAAPRREKVSSALFFKYNTQLGPPYRVLVDTNFINFSIKNKVWAARGPPPRPAPPQLSMRVHPPRPKSAQA